MAVPFHFRPQVGFGPVSLGAPRFGVRTALAEAGIPLYQTDGDMDYFCQNALQVEYEDGSVIFIGTYLSDAFDAVYAGVHVFDMEAEALFDLIAAGEPGQRAGFSTAECYFPGQVMTLWDADTQYDRLGGESREVWCQVGIGDARYAQFRRGLEAG